MPERGNGKTNTFGSSVRALGALDPSLGVVELTRQLCDLPSESGEERLVADEIEALLRQEAPHLEVLRDGEAIVASTQLGRERRVLIAGHIDTVPVHGTLPTRVEHDAETGETVIWGRGTVDMKSGVAVQVALALECTEPPIDITWIWYDNEEVEADRNGLARLLRNHPQLRRADVAILGEPSAGFIELGCNGTMTARVAFRGRKAHTARAWMGVNAIHRMDELLTKLRHLEPENLDVEGLIYRESVQAVRCQAGLAGNVVPDLAEIDINFRFAPCRTPQEAETYLRAVCEGVDDFEVIDVAGGAAPDLGKAEIASIVKWLDRPVKPKLGWTDVARFHTLGIPAINFGPGDPTLAHSDDERVDASQIVDVWSALREWLTHGSN